MSLSVPLEIRAVSTQGQHGSGHRWVTSYTLSWSADAQVWNNYTDGTGVVVSMMVTTMTVWMKRMTVVVNAMVVVIMIMMMMMMMTQY